MKVAQVIPCLGQNSGGPSRSVYNLTKGLRMVGLDTEILTNNYRWNPNIASDEWIKAIECHKSRWHEYNPEYKRLLQKCINDKKYSLYHIHSIYSYPSTIASMLFRSNNVPYIIAPRGSLYPSAIDVSSKLNKLLFNKLFLLRELNHASAIHVTCEEEMKAVRSLGVKSSIAIIPNAIYLPEERPKVPLLHHLRICYLGRISAQKNLLGLFKAWKLSGMADDNGVELMLIGPAHTEKDKKYKEQLLRYEQENHISNIRWMGARNGRECDDLLQSCSFLVLPSFSENFGMVVPEALKFGIPVIASRGTPWQVLEQQKCGWWTNFDVNSLAASLLKLKEIKADERRSMGLRGQQLVWTFYSVETVSKQLVSLYSWIINNGRKPDFVY